MRIYTAEPPEHVEALELLFRHRPTVDMQQRIMAAQEMLATAPRDAVRLIVARDGHAVVGAALAEVLPGATGVVWPPCGDSPAIEDALLSEAVQWLQASGAKLAQSVLLREDKPLADVLLRGGFSQPTQLCYLATQPILLDLGKADFERYDRLPATLFHQALRRSHERGLDFPELDGRRSPEDVLRGYQAGGFDPARWWLLRVAGEPVGVLILTDIDRDLDLTYVGVVPEQRGRGFGRMLVRKAIAEAYRAGAESITVCVDARNTPAILLYDQLGFTEFDRRDVFLYLW